VGCINQRSYCNPALPETIDCVDGRVWKQIGMDSSDPLQDSWPDVRDRPTMRAYVSLLSAAYYGNPDELYTMPGLPALLSRNTLCSNQQNAIVPGNR
jgi:hypothetical protein